MAVSLSWLLKAIASYHLPGTPGGVKRFYYLRAILDYTVNSVGAVDPIPGSSFYHSFNSFTFGVKEGLSVAWPQFQSNQLPIIHHKDVNITITFDQCVSPVSYVPPPLPTFRFPLFSIVLTETYVVNFTFYIIDTHKSASFNCSYTYENFQNLFPGYAPEHQFNLSDWTSDVDSDFLPGFALTHLEDVFETIINLAYAAGFVNNSDQIHSLIDSTILGQILSHTLSPGQQFATTGLSSHLGFVRNYDTDPIIIQSITPGPNQLAIPFITSAPFVSTLYCVQLNCTGDETWVVSGSDDISVDYGAGTWILPVQLPNLPTPPKVRPFNPFVKHFIGPTVPTPPIPPTITIPFSDLPNVPFILDDQFQFRRWFNPCNVAFRNILLFQNLVPFCFDDEDQDDDIDLLPDGPPLMCPANFYCEHPAVLDYDFLTNTWRCINPATNTDVPMTPEFPPSIQPPGSNPVIKPDPIPLNHTPEPSRDACQIVFDVQYMTPSLPSYLIQYEVLETTRIQQVTFQYGSYSPELTNSTWVEFPTRIRFTIRNDFEQLPVDGSVSDYHTYEISATDSFELLSAYYQQPDGPSFDDPDSVAEYTAHYPGKGDVTVFDWNSDSDLRIPRSGEIYSRPVLLKLFQINLGFVSSSLGNTFSIYLSSNLGSYNYLVRTFGNTFGYTQGFHPYIGFQKSYTTYPSAYHATVLSGATTGPTNSDRRCIDRQNGITCSSTRRLLNDPRKDVWWAHAESECQFNYPVVSVIPNPRKYLILTMFFFPSLFNPRPSYGLPFWVASLPGVFKLVKRINWAIGVFTRKVHVRTFSYLIPDDLTSSYALAPVIRPFLSYGYIDITVIRTDLITGTVYETVLYTTYPGSFGTSKIGLPVLYYHELNESEFTNSTTMSNYDTPIT